MVEVRKVLSASFESKGDAHMRNGWVSGLRAFTKGCGNGERTTCCEKMEETVSSPLLSPNKRTLIKEGAVSKAKRNVRARSSVPEKKKRNNGGDDDLQPGRDFITECSSPKKHKNDMYVFRSLQAKTISGKVNYLPSNCEIPLIEI